MGKTGRKCNVCLHAERDSIDVALLSGESFRDVSRRFQVSKPSVARHKAGHLPAALAKSQEARETIRADSLLGQVRNLQTKTLATLAQAESAGDLRTVLVAIREARGNLALLATLLGELQVQPTYNTFVTSSEWVTLRTMILRALEPFPEARLAMVTALEGY